MNVLIEAEEMTIVCAWCGSTLKAGGPHLSHGLCAACAERMLAEAGLQAGRSARRSARIAEPA
jgi:hypothetical protein